MTIGVSELQKNISIFKNLNESVHVIDKKTKEILAIIMPKQEIETKSLTESLGGILSHKTPSKEYQDINQIVDNAFDAEMREKYGK